MVQTETVSQQWERFRPSKKLWFWSLLGASVATMIVGFTVGGWTTGGTATSMADRASKDAKAELAASICVQKFVSAEGAAEKLALLKEKSSWERDNFVEEGGWAKLLGMEKPVPGSADLCAGELVAMESLPVRTVEPTAGDS